jgi:hypothetical protein
MHRRLPDLGRGATESAPWRVGHCGGAGRGLHRCWYAISVLSKKKQARGIAALARGESRAILLAGVALNWIGAVKLAREVWLRERCADPPADYDQLKAFAAGTAATFGAFYLYLYVNDEPAVPLLMFGASLKTWAFVLSVVLRAQNRLDRENLVSFGVSNGVVGGLFWVHILRSATADRTD